MFRVPAASALELLTLPSCRRPSPERSRSTRLSGSEKNRATIEVFSEQARALGIIDRRVTAEEYFAEYLESPAR